MQYSRDDLELWIEEVVPEKKGMDGFWIYPWEARPECSELAPNPEPPNEMVQNEA